MKFVYSFVLVGGLNSAVWASEPTQPVKETVDLVKQAPISLDFLLYLSQLTEVDGELIGPLEMTEEVMKTTIQSLAEAKKPDVSLTTSAPNKESNHE